MYSGATNETIENLYILFQVQIIVCVMAWIDGSNSFAMLLALLFLFLFLFLVVVVRRRA
jgi:hypothetical protein